MGSGREPELGAVILSCVTASLREAVTQSKGPYKLDRSFLDLEMADKNS
jgi:hypothetical protein